MVGCIASTNKSTNNVCNCWLKASSIQTDTMTFQLNYFSPDTRGIRCRQRWRRWQTMRRHNPFYSTYADAGRRIRRRTNLAGAESNS